PRIRRSYVQTARFLPPVVGERLVRLGHLVRVLALLHRVALVLRGIEDLRGELLDHRLFAALARVVDEPPHPQRLRPVRPDVDRDLAGRADDAARLDLDLGLDVRQRLLPHLHRIVLGALGDDVERLVDDLLRDGLLAAVHHGVDELGQAAAQLVRRVGELRIRENLALGDFTFAGHRWDLTWGAWRRTWSGSGDGSPRRRYRGCRARCGTERRGDPSRGRRGSGRPSAPAGCAPRPGYRM